MGWFRRKKQVAPLIPGRDRTSTSVKTRPVYSYYAGRPVSDKTSRQAPQPRSVSSVKPLARFQFLSTYAIVVAVCTLVVAVCIVKLLAVSPDSKIIVSATNGYPVSQLAIGSYATSADALLRGSLLNRSKITLNTNGIASSLQKQFPELTSVVVTVPLVGNRPVIYVSPSKPAFTLQTTSGLYSMDAEGYVLARLSAPAPGLTTLKDISNRTPQPQKRRNIILPLRYPTLK